MRMKFLTSDFLNHEINRCKISVWEVILDAQDTVNIPRLMHDPASVKQILSWQITNKAYIH